MSFKVINNNPLGNVDIQPLGQGRLAIKSRTGKIYVGIQVGNVNNTATRDLTIVAIFMIATLAIGLTVAATTSVQQSAFACKTIRTS